MKKLFYITLISLLVFSCTEEPKVKPFGYTKFFTGENNKTWKVKVWEETLNGKVIDRTTYTCMNDDQFIFYANPERRTEFKSGSNKCFDENPEPALIADSWSYQSGSVTLTMIFPYLADFSLPFIVREIDEDDMVLEIFFVGNEGSYRIHFEAIDED